MAAGGAEFLELKVTLGHFLYMLFDRRNMIKTLFEKFKQIAIAVKVYVKSVKKELPS